MTPNDIDTEYEQFMADAPTSNIVDEEYEQFKADEQEIQNPPFSLQYSIKSLKA